MTTGENEETTEEHVPSGSDYVSDRRFADFPISTELLQGIKEHGYVTATPVQSQTVEPALAGRDLLVRAKTGTGKTAAFCVPILERIPIGHRGAKALILAPTRELAQQIAEEATALAAHRDIRIATLVGGMSMGPQIDALNEGAALLVGTPGRVLDHYRRQNADLKSCDIACLDEADEMLSMGFYEDVTAALDACAPDRQILLYSATISNDTQRIIQKYLKDPEEIILSTDEDRVEGIDHILYENPPGQHRIRSLMYVVDLEKIETGIIFCNTREDAATVASFLDRQGFDARLLSGELPQKQRNRVMTAMKNGEVTYLVATDVAARGIDISDVTHVINYALPNDPKVYLHRIGRTGRIGKQGKAINLISATDIGTRKTLETQHGIAFDVKPFPEMEEIVRLRTDRQAAQIRAAMGSMAFEAYLPTVRELKERPDGDVLLAAALRAFFQWNRMRRASLDSDLDTPAEESRGRSDSGERDRKGRDRKGRDRKGRDRRDQSEDRDASGRRERGKKRKGRSERRAEDTIDLDALLVDDGSASSAAPAASPAAEDDAKQKKKRRRRKKKSGDSGEGTGTSPAAESGGGSLPDDLDALLMLD